MSDNYGAECGFTWPENEKTHFCGRPAGHPERRHICYCTGSDQGVMATYEEGKDCAVCGRRAITVLANGQGMCPLHWTPAVDVNIPGPGPRPEMDAEGRVVLAPLPLLTAEELDELHLAIKDRMNMLARIWSDQVLSVPTQADAQRRGQILQSLDTAVQEARASLR